MATPANNSQNKTTNKASRVSELRGTAQAAPQPRVVKNNEAPTRPNLEPTRTPRPAQEDNRRNSERNLDSQIAAGNMTAEQENAVLDAAIAEEKAEIAAEMNAGAAREEKPQQNGELDVGAMEEEDLNAAGMNVLSADQMADIEARREQLRKRNEGRIDTEEDEDDDEYKKNKDDFTKGDVIDYMYEKWFLKLLSKGFDKLDKLAEKWGKKFGKAAGNAIKNTRENLKNRERADRFLSLQKQTATLAGKQITSIQKHADDIIFNLAAHEAIVAGGYDKKDPFTGEDMHKIYIDAENRKYMLTHNGEQLSEDQKKVLGNKELSGEEFDAIRKLQKNPNDIKDMVPTGERFLDDLSKLPDGKARAERYTQQMKMAHTAAEFQVMATKLAAGRTVYDLAGQALKNGLGKGTESKIVLAFGKNFVAEQRDLVAAPDKEKYLTDADKRMDGYSKTFKNVLRDTKDGTKIGFIESEKTQGQEIVGKMSIKEMAADAGKISPKLEEQINEANAQQAALNAKDARRRANAGKVVKLYDKIVGNKEQKADKKIEKQVDNAFNRRLESGRE